MCVKYCKAKKKANPDKFKHYNFNYRLKIGSLKIKEYNKQYYQRYPEKVKANCKKQSKTAMTNLYDSYVVKSSFQGVRSVIPNYAISLAREMLKAKRQLKELI